jgi:hypothetical protein
MSSHLLLSERETGKCLLGGGDPTPDLGLSAVCPSIVTPEGRLVFVSFAHPLNRVAEYQNTKALG